jgi:phosphomannomutase/phosphoglucomutase
MSRYWLFIFFIICPYMLFSVADEAIFKEYDIRGIVGKEFTIQDTYQIGCAIASFYNESGVMVKKVAVGADGRVHSPAIKEQMIEGLRSNGFDIIDIGTCPTPVLYFALHHFGLDAGIMITASHNPGEYNGVKMCLGKHLLSGNDIKRVRSLYFNPDKRAATEVLERGSYGEEDMISYYLDFLTNQFSHLKGMGIRAVVDCGNGAAGTVMPLLLERMQWEGVMLLYPEVDGTYPNHIADPTVESYMADLKKTVIHANAELGLGFDGDGDRMAPMTSQGRLIKGDLLLALQSRLILERFPGSAVVFDISSSKSLLQIVKQWGGVPILSQTGVANVKKKMAETGAWVGGEMSCHTIFKDRYYGYDDGFYSLLRLFELFDRTGLSLDQLLTDIPAVCSSPTYRLPCPREVCFEVVHALTEHFAHRSDCELITIDGLRVHLPNGWGIVRASNTEPLISMRFEGDSSDDLEAIKQEFQAIFDAENIKLCL